MESYPRNNNNNNHILIKIKQKTKNELTKYTNDFIDKIAPSGFEDNKFVEKPNTFMTDRY